MKKRFMVFLLALTLTLGLTAWGSNSGEEQTTSSGEVTIEEQVVLDDQGVKVTVKSLGSGLYGAELNLLIENDSDSDLTFQVRNVSVNGYMMDPTFSADVVAGKKTNDAITFMDYEFEECGIDSIADIEFSLHVFTTDDWEDYLDTDQITLKTSIADTYEYSYDDSGDVAYDANGIKVVVKGLLEDSSYLGPSVILYIENNSDQDITVQVRDVSVNGFMIDPVFSCEVVAGKKAVDDMTFMSSDLEDNDITSIDSIELSFHIFENTGWDTIVDTDVVTITF